jgi:hypothetical protein
MSVAWLRLLCWSLAVVSAAWSTVAAGAADPELFTAIKGPISGTNLADLGVVDANGDGHLDVFTSSHVFRTVLQLGDGRGGFTDVSDEWGLAVDSRVPYLEGAAEVPASPPGLHIYFEGKEMVVRTSRPGASFSGRIDFTRPVAFAAEGDMAAVGAQGPEGPLPRSAFVEFASSGVGLWRTASWFPHHHVQVALAPVTPLEQVFVGRNATPAYAHTMALALVDRHGLAWSDFDGDGDMDVFISVGGMLGAAPEELRDELFVRDGKGSRNAIDESGIAKNRGRARRVEWVDFDGDGRLDLYVGNVATPNQLWRQDGAGRFENVAGALGLDVKKGDSFRWMDVDGDADADLLLAIPGGPALLFVNDGGRFSRRRLDGCRADLPNHMAVGDFDGDGDLDVFVADSAMNRVFVAENGSFRCRDATEFGLPARSATANWVDFDNDGLLDVHLVPGGLRRQTADGRFLFAGLVLGNVPNFARCAWFDVDADGDRDCVCTVARDGGASEHFQFRNESHDHRGMAVQVVGPPLNRQAIGATVLSSVGGRLRRHMVGESDGAHWSQGHYRIYVGLGTAARADWLEVTWPDGTRQRLESPPPDQALPIRWRGGGKQTPPEPSP